MKALVVEDQVYIRKGLINLLNKLKPNINIIGECDTVKDAVVVTNTCKPELIFLDINLLDGNAFDFLEKTQHLEFKVIFITAYEEYALQALKAGAVDYLLKPIDVDELKAALEKINVTEFANQKLQIEKVEQVFNNESDTLILSLQDSFQIVNLKTLMFCESNKGYTTFYMSTGQKHIASKPLKEFEKQLVKNNFTRPHQSFMVNLKYIDKYDKSGVIYLNNQQKIPVSSRKKDDFLTVLFNWNKV